MVTDAQAAEFRAYWVDAFNPGIKSPTQIDEMLATVRASNMNAVIVQMRRRGNTFYPSRIDPWAPDADPSFDSLDYLIRKAHELSPRVEVHCWFCTMPVWKEQTMPEDPDHVCNLHPEWLTCNQAGEAWDGENYCLDPGVPEAAQYTVDVIMEVAERYDVDGVHYDYIRYAGNTSGYNPVSLARFNALHGRSGTPSETDPEWMQFRRDQVSAIVRKVYVNAVAIKPNLKMTASTITWGDGPITEEDWRKTAAYSDVLQDWRAWMEEGIIDISFPMTYYNDDVHPSYYDHWIAYQKSHKYGRHLVIGVGSYMNSKANALVQLAETRTPFDGSTPEGQCLYSFNSPHSDGRGQAAGFAGDLAAAVYPSPVPVPDMPWKSAPTLGHIRGTVTSQSGKALDGVAVSLSGPHPRSMVADCTGFYAFVDLAPGQYTVTASRPGALTVSATVRVAAGAVADADLANVADA